MTGSRVTGTTGRIRVKLLAGGLGKRGIEALLGGLILAVAAGGVTAAAMVIEGARAALHGAQAQDRPDVIDVKARFNRALFETPRSGSLPPATLPVHVPLVTPRTLAEAVAGTGATIAPRQSLLRNVVWPTGFSNTYLFGIQPAREQRIGSFTVAAGRFLHDGDRDAAVLDQATAAALGVGVGDRFPVRQADGTDRQLTVVGILRRFELRDPPIASIPAPGLRPGSPLVSGGALVTIQTSSKIVGRTELTDALVVARRPGDVPGLVQRLQHAFRSQPGVFVEETYAAFSRKVHDFRVTLATFAAASVLAMLLAGALAASLLQDAHAQRRRQYATLLAVGFPPRLVGAYAAGLGGVIALGGTLLGAAIAAVAARRPFGMPSLLADLGTIAPRFDAAVAAIVTGVALGAVAVGLAPAVIALARAPVARTIGEEA